MSNKSINHSLINLNLKVSKAVSNSVRSHSFRDKECLSSVISNLITCGDGDRVILYSRETGGTTYTYRWNKKGISNYRVVKAIDYLESIGLIFNQVSSAYQMLDDYKKMSLCYPTADFINLFCTGKDVVKKARQDQIDAYPVVILRDKEKNDMPFRETAEVRDYIASMQLLNKSNNLFTVLHNGLAIDTEYKRIFNEGSFIYNGRMYSNNIMGIENRTSKDRLKLLIDNMPVAEVDYNGLHIRLLADLHNETIPDGDVYYLMLPEDKRTVVNRKVIKQCTVNMLNVSSPMAAMITFRKPLEDFPDNTIGSPKEILEHIYSVLGELSRDALYKDFIGMKLCNIESRILSRVCSSFVELGLPVFPIHDSALVRQCDAELLACMMADYYRQEMNVDSVVNMSMEYLEDGKLVKKDVSQ